MEEPLRSSLVCSVSETRDTQQNLPCSWWPRPRCGHICKCKKSPFLGGEGGLIHDVALTYFPVIATLSPSNDSRWCCIHMCPQGNGISIRDGWSLKMKFVDKHRMLQQTKSSRPISECWYNLSRPQHPISCYIHASPICASLVCWSRRDSLK